MNIVKERAKKQRSEERENKQEKKERYRMILRNKVNE